MPRPGHQIYEEEMILKGHGFPVWYGDPYGGAEIEIGDIGYMRKGAFVHVMKCNFNFNELITTPVNFNGPIYSQSLERRESGAEAARVLTPPGVGSVNPGHISMTSCRDTCAMLNLEEGVADYTHCSDVDKEAVGEFFFQNARKWIAEAVKGRRFASNISIERLILVTGFYKSANWEAAALYSSSSTENLSFTIKNGGGISINWDSVQHLSPDYSTGHRHPGPQTDLNKPQTLAARGTGDITHRTNHPAGHRVSFAKCCHQHSDRTQCIFLRGFRIRGCLGRKDQVDELLASEEPKLSWGERFRRFAKTFSKTSKPPIGESSQRRSYYLEPIEGFSDTNFCVSCHQVDEH
ncbi:uncharacterized protein LACBIDRAFT_313148 [Laccaria bicolor S238N-H82]|uniref:Predicted protein n=1 Tax=Laccaria bicolor (strain S238N-H82 / ATCC MYA-4686) TaxID=486041 RepID=B0DXM7_LACBS|nr:uncharacterized protein LACBIDRAFT_313148 [Laccaria bicolor S238N-H82]EDR00708.1 predicted protein [Laccaria bicolor S238N-H82]|eukprot:XP_001888717.1 predicted protein [Laccaria bicolor S238N-H82]